MVPCAFCLLPDKKAETYKKALIEVASLKTGLFRG